ncbi:RidA family protein, partial [Cupriavidus plantarum]|uniref:RidA family protein n=1 Tax=Cupriavidus plantarum TaxID=942865 RepID=UPI00339D7A55
MNVYDKLAALGIELPAAAAPAAAYVMSAQTGNVVYLSGHIAKRDGAVWAGKLGATMTTEEGKVAARRVAIDLLATLHSHLGDLNRVTRIVKVMSLVNSTMDYTEQHRLKQSGRGAGGWAGGGGMGGPAAGPPGAGGGGGGPATSSRYAAAR